MSGTSPWMEANVERVTAAVVLALGSLVLLATVVSVALGDWETTLGKGLFLLVVLVGMWRALGHLPRPSHESHVAGAQHPHCG